MSYPMRQLPSNSEVMESWLLTPGETGPPTEVILYDFGALLGAGDGENYVSVCAVGELYQILGRWLVKKNELPPPTADEAKAAFLSRMAALYDQHGEPTEVGEDSSLVRWVLW